MEDSGKSKNSLSEVLLGIGFASQCLLGILGLVSVILVFAKGGIFLFDNVLPYVELVSAIALFTIIPCSILLIIFKKTRPWGGFGFFIYSLVLGGHLWFWSLVLAKIFAGTFWMVVGLLLAGIGVIPISLIATAFSGEWELFGGILFSGVIAFVSRTIGVAALGVKEVNQSNPVPGDISPEQLEAAKAINRWFQTPDDTELSDMRYNLMLDKVRALGFEPDQEAALLKAMEFAGGDEYVKSVALEIYQSERERFVSKEEWEKTMETSSEYFDVFRSSPK